MIAQEWEVSAPRFLANGFRFPMPDVTSVSVLYDDADGVEQTVNAGSHAIASNALGHYLRWGDAWAVPTLRNDGLADPIRYRFTCGMAADAEGVPAALKTAIALMVGDLYENRADVSERGGKAVEMPVASSMLAAPFRARMI